MIIYTQKSEKVILNEWHGASSQNNNILCSENVWKCHKTL